MKCKQHSMRNFDKVFSVQFTVEEGKKLQWSCRSWGKRSSSREVRCKGHMAGLYVQEGRIVKVA